MFFWLCFFFFWKKNKTNLLSDSANQALSDVDRPLDRSSQISRLTASINSGWRLAVMPSLIFLISCLGKRESACVCFKHLAFVFFFCGGCCYCRPCITTECSPVAVLRSGKFACSLTKPSLLNSMTSSWSTDCHPTALVIVFIHMMQAST